MSNNAGANSREIPAKEERLLVAIGKRFPLAVSEDANGLSFIFLDNDVEQMHQMVVPPDPQLSMERRQQQIDEAFAHHHLEHLRPFSVARSIVDQLQDLTVATLLFLKSSVTDSRLLVAEPNYPTFIKNQPQGFNTGTGRMPEGERPSRPTFLLCLVEARDTETRLMQVFGDSYIHGVPLYTQSFLRKISTSEIPDLANGLRQTIMANRGWHLE